VKVVSTAYVLPVALAILAAGTGLTGCGTQAADRPHPIVSMSPLAIAPSESGPGPCPRSGMRLSAGEANAAMGLRVQTMTLTNCGRKARQVNGYPRVEVLDEDGERLSVELDRGARRVTTAVKDSGDKELTVRRGRSVRFDLVWRNTYDDTSEPPRTGVTVIVTTGRSSEHRFSMNSPLDLGSTRLLGITAWEPA
jgi:hypothetical protein